MDKEQFSRLVKQLCSLPAETPWAEFKRNNAEPQMIGELISALSNAAVLEGKETGYIVWGVENGTHALVGTTFIPSTTKKSNEDLEGWLVRMLTPRLHIRFHRNQVNGQDIVILEIPAARDQPTAFSGKELVRIGSTNRALRDVPDRERALWRSFDAKPFERQIMLADEGDEDVLRLLDYPSYFELLNQPLPDDRTRILAELAEEKLIQKNDTAHWDITGLGAILLARDLTRFPSIGRKTVRLIIYKGRDRMVTEREHEVQKGYAVGFESLMKFLGALLPYNESIESALREEVSMYPPIALRELVANALIHQDFTIPGSGPMIEVFKDRIEIMNPGVPFGDIARLLDQPPRSRNEALAAFMRRIGVCEERGSGVDKIVFETELYQLPSPRWEASRDAFRAVLFAQRKFREMSRADRVHACYLHACLKYVRQEQMTNSSLRQRFGFDEKNSAMVSRIIKDALEDGLIKPYDPQQGKRHARYIPLWA